MTVKELKQNISLWDVKLKKATNNEEKLLALYYIQNYEYRLNRLKQEKKESEGVIDELSH